MKLNKKGFTLVELLAVIVVLAILIVVAGSTVGSTMNNAKKNALKTETQKILSTIYQDIYSAKMLNSANIIANILVDDPTTDDKESIITLKETKEVCIADTSKTTKSDCITAGKKWSKYKLTGIDGDFNFQIMFDEDGNIIAYLVNYQKAYSIITKEAGFSINNSPKLPDNITIATGESSF